MSIRRTPVHMKLHISKKMYAYMTCIKDSRLHVDDKQHHIPLIPSSEAGIRFIQLRTKVPRTGTFYGYPPYIQRPQRPIFHIHSSSIIPLFLYLFYIFVQFSRQCPGVMHLLQI